MSQTVCPKCGYVMDPLDKVCRRCQGRGLPAAPTVPLTFPCPNCGQQLQVPPEHAGKPYKCTRCGALVTAPQAASAMREPLRPPTTGFAPPEEPSAFDRQFGSGGILGNWVAIVALNMLCVPMALALGLISLAMCRTAEGKLWSKRLAIVSGVWFLAGLVLFVVTVAIGVSSSPRGGGRLGSRPGGGGGLRPIVTMDEYNRVQQGMTYEQVVDIVGEEGQEVGRTLDLRTKTVLYRWANPDGSYMVAMFQNGRVAQKAQYGLK